MDDVLFLGAVGTNISAPNGSSSAATAIPVASDGNAPKVIRVSAASGSIYFAIGKSSVAATTGHTIISVSDSQRIQVGSNTHVAVWGIGAVIPVVVTPLENQR